DSILTPEDMEAKTVITLSPQSIRKEEFQEFDKDDSNECTIITEKYTVKHQPKVEYILKPEELSSQEGNKVILPAKANFGVADLFITPQDIFQVTVSQHHPIKQTELVNLVKNLPAHIKDTDAKIQFYFIVPNDIYDTFKYQYIVMHDNDTSTF
ncbi:3474_t:CDS:2, partial [Racocetra persica]